MVLRTIIDNISSFFQKEDSLLKDPKGVPDAASETFAKPEPQEDRPVKEESPAPAPKKSLPSSDDLRAALEAREQQSSSEPERPAPDPEPQPAEESAPQLDLDDLRAFEESVQSFSGPAQESQASPRHNPLPDRSRPPLKDGFFSSFEEFFDEHGADVELDGDLLHKMRSFHERRHSGHEPLVGRESAEASVRRRLRELQSLEHEWQRMYSESRELERSMMHLEEEIDERVQALRVLLGETKKLSLLSEECSEGDAFVLASGSRVRSLGALLRALRADPSLFEAHVREGRNDFSSWVRSVFGHSQLADRLSSCSSLGAFLEVFDQG